MNRVGGNVVIKHEAANAVIQTQNSMGFLQNIDRVMQDFLEWQNGLYRMLVSKEAMDCEDPFESSPLLSSFGTWYASLPKTSIAHDQALADLAELYERLYSAACSLIATHRQQDQVSAEVFENFSNIAENFKLSLLKYQRRIISEVCMLDPLTGTGNRYAMDLRLTEEWERSRRTNLPSAVCLADLDFFKKVNDVYGHAAGDMVLRVVASFIKSRERVYDDVFRYGGEEFLVCLPNTTLANATKVFERLCTGLNDIKIPVSEEKNIKVSASFGVARLMTDVAIEQSIEHADKALFRAKSEGRNRVCAWEENATAA